MNLRQVNSSRMFAVGWNNNVMYIQFKNGKIYAYENVSKMEYISFINSSSLGKSLETFQKYHQYHPV